MSSSKTPPTLQEAMEYVLGRPLTATDMQQWDRYKELFNYSDDDPIIPVLVMLGMNRVEEESFLVRFREEAAKTIALHQQTLRDQSALAAKDVIAQVCTTMRLASLENSTTSWRGRIITAAIGAAIGIGIGLAIALPFLKH